MRQRSDQDSANEKLLSISVPHDMARKPRSLEVIKYWKGRLPEGVKPCIYGEFLNLSLNFSFGNSAFSSELWTACLERNSGPSLLPSSCTSYHWLVGSAKEWCLD